MGKKGNNSKEKKKKEASGDDFPSKSCENNCMKAAEVGSFCSNSSNMDVWDDQDPCTYSSGISKDDSLSEQASFVKVSSNRRVKAKTDSLINISNRFEALEDDEELNRKQPCQDDVSEDIPCSQLSVSEAKNGEHSEFVGKMGSISDNSDGNAKLPHDYFI